MPLVAFLLFLCLSSALAAPRSQTTVVTLSQTFNTQPQVHARTPTSSVAQERQTCLPCQHVKLRHPPTLNVTLDRTWTPPPPAWLFGNWKITYSSRPSYHTLYNFQHDCYPGFPMNASIAPGLQFDLMNFKPSPKSKNTTIKKHHYQKTPLSKNTTIKKHHYQKTPLSKNTTIKKHHYQKTPLSITRFSPLSGMILPWPTWRLLYIASTEQVI